MYVNNGETGAVISLPFSLDTPTMFFPYDLASVVNNSRDNDEITLEIDTEKRMIKAKTSGITIKFRTLDPDQFPGVEVPEDLITFETAELYEKVKLASPYISPDASLPLLQAVRINTNSVCACDQARVWIQNHASPHAFCIPKLMVDHICRLGLEPNMVGISTSSLYFFYADLIIYGMRLAGEENYPKVPEVMEKIKLLEDMAEIQYDREQLMEKLSYLLTIDLEDKAIRMGVQDNILTIETLVTDSGSTEGKIQLPVVCPNSFGDVVINSQLFSTCVAHFNTLKIKADNQRLLFVAKDKCCGMSRRAV
jgi:DNA polymerase III sliding clamp (beta) subunit (PCNA family)